MLNEKTNHSDSVRGSIKQRESFIGSWLHRMVYESKEPTFQKVLVNPELAHLMLELNKHNRTITAPHVKNYARQMKAGTFRDTPQPISFDRSGRLLDGQHRLLALIDANVELPFRVFFGEDPDIFPVIDIGRKRTAGDSLSTVGVVNATNVASLIRCDLSITEGYTTRSRGCHITTQEIMHALSEPEFAHVPEAVKFLKSLNRVQKVLKTNSGVGAAFLRILRVNDADRVHEFADSITFGLNISSQNDPISRLRTKLMASIPNNVEAAAITIKTWNAWVRQAPIGLLRWSPPERFPVPVRATTSA